MFRLSLKLKSDMLAFLNAIGARENIVRNFVKTINDLYNCAESRFCKKLSTTELFITLMARLFTKSSYPSFKEYL